MKELEEAQLEFYKIITVILNKARNKDEDLIEYIEEQQAILKTDIAIDNDEKDKIIELSQPQIEDNSK